MKIHECKIKDIFVTLTGELDIFGHEVLKNITEPNTLLMIKTLQENANMKGQLSISVLVNICTYKLKHFAN